MLHLLPKEDGLLEEIQVLLERKKVTLEKELAPRIDKLNAFIEAELARLESFSVEKDEKAGGMEQLNALFRQMVREI